VHTTTPNFGAAYRCASKGRVSRLHQLGIGSPVDVPPKHSTVRHPSSRSFSPDVTIVVSDSCDYANAHAINNVVAPKLCISLNCFSTTTIIDFILYHCRMRCALTVRLGHVHDVRANFFFVIATTHTSDYRRRICMHAILNISSTTLMGVSSWHRSSFPRPSRALTSMLCTEVPILCQHQFEMCLIVTAQPSRGCVQGHASVCTNQ
jgi:hypothetical protein